MTDPLQVVGSVVASKYEVNEFLGSFGPRVVYRAQHRAWAEAVRIEFLAPDGSGDPQAAEAQRRGFVRAGAAVCRLSSRWPAIVQPRDGGIEATARGDAAYTVYEWVEGSPLKDAFARAKVVDDRQSYGHEVVLEWFAPVFDAMIAAHDEGIVHAHLDHAALWVVGDLGPRCTLKLDGLVEGAWRGALPGSSLPLRGPDAEFAAPELSSCDATLLGPWTDVYGLVATMAVLACGSTRPEALERALPPGVRYAFEKGLGARIDARFKSIASFRASVLEGLDSGIETRGQNVPRRTMVVSDVRSELSEGSAGGFEVSDDDDVAVEPPARGEVKTARVRLAFTQPALSIPESILDPETSSKHDAKPAAAAATNGPRSSLKNMAAGRRSVFRSRSGCRWIRSVFGVARTPASSNSSLSSNSSRTPTKNSIPRSSRWCFLSNRFLSNRFLSRHQSSRCRTRRRFERQ